MFLRSPFQHNTLFNIPELDFNIQPGSLILIKENLSNNHLHLLSLIDAPVYSKDYESLKLLTNPYKKIEECDNNMKIAWRYSDTPTIQEKLYKPTTNRIVKEYKSINDINYTSKLIILSLNSPQNKITDKELFYLKQKAIINNSIIFISSPNLNNLYFDLVLTLSNDPTKTYNAIINIEKIKEKKERINYLISNKLGMIVKHKSIKIENIKLPPENNENKSIDF